MAIQLTNRSVVASNKVQSFSERMYLPAIVKGMMITFSHLFKKTPTLKYPEQKRQYAPVYRGQHVLKRDENGAERLLGKGDFLYKTSTSEVMNRAHSAFVTINDIATIIAQSDFLRRQYAKNTKD